MDVQIQEISLIRKITSNVHELCGIRTECHVVSTSQHTHIRGTVSEDEKSEVLTGFSVMFFDGCIIFRRIH